MNDQAMSTPFPSKFFDIPSIFPKLLPDFTNIDIVPKYQCLVGCLLYIAVVSHPNISYYAMWLGQFNVALTCFHFLTAKHVLRYLAGTQKLALCFGAPSTSVPVSINGFMQNIGCSDVNWVSDTSDWKSISGCSFYFLFPGPPSSKSLLCCL